MKPLAAPPAVPSKVISVEAFGSLFGGKNKATAHVAKPVPVPKLAAPTLPAAKKVSPVQ